MFLPGFRRPLFSKLQFLNHIFEVRRVFYKSMILRDSNYDLYESPGAQNFHMSTKTTLKFQSQLHKTNNIINYSQFILSKSIQFTYESYFSLF